MQWQENKDVNRGGGREISVEESKLQARTVNTESSSKNLRFDRNWEENGIIGGWK